MAKQSHLDRIQAKFPKAEQDKFRAKVEAAISKAEQAVREIDQNWIDDPFPG